MESSVIFLWNGVFILNGKENKEATEICFEIRIPKKKNKELLWKVPSKRGTGFSDMDAGHLTLFEFQAT